MTMYMCSVYSLDNADKELMQKRYEYARERLFLFLLEGLPVFSPIVHCHEVSKHHDLPKTWEFWEKLDIEYINNCTELWVLEMPGWRRSVGVTAEIKHAETLGMNIRYFKCDDYSE